MARTFLIDADGTRFIEETASRRRTRRVIAWGSLVAASPFFLAALIGLYLAATGDSAQAETPLPKPLPAAIKACEDAPRQYQGYCIGLYLRPAYTLDIEDGATTHTPAGPALVRECMTQGLDHSELGACLTQPIS